MASHSAYEIAADSDEEEVELVATAASSLLPPGASQPSSGKGKGRATSPAAVEGKIGSNASGNAGFGERTSRQTVGGIQTETRSVDSLASCEEWALIVGAWEGILGPILSTNPSPSLSFVGPSAIAYRTEELMEVTGR